MRYEQFIESYNHQKNFSRILNVHLRNGNTLRTKADEIILSIWNEVEANYAELPDDERRDKATEYGLTYVYRKNEIKGLKLLDRSLPSLFS